MQQGEKSEYEQKTGVRQTHIHTLLSGMDEWVDWVTA